NLTGLSREYGSGRPGGQKRVRKSARASRTPGGPAVFEVHQGGVGCRSRVRGSQCLATWRNEMQGTIVMLMALSGLGCHHKSCDVAYVPSYYGTGACYGGCYGGGYATVVEPSCYSGCYSSGYSGCYSSGYGGCYGGCYDSCYSGRRHGCLLSALFHCFGGLFGHHRAYDYGGYDGDYGFYSTSYSDYFPADFDSSMPIYETPMTTGEG